ncbi:hypothetical protein MMC09_003911 [Bachmanniomyces sp. S44760]|nr:hypothetical protein [Bachmanniomyces sp. S44760]
MSKPTFTKRTTPLDLSKVDLRAWPKFILDLGPDFLSEPEWIIAPHNKPPTWQWTIHCLEDFVKVPANKTLFETNGYGAISYAWGFEYKGKPIPNHPLTDPIPSMPDPKYKWEFPQCALLFNLNDIRRVFKTMQKRFVWWDHACIPQQDLSKGYPAPALTPLLSTVRSEEVAKQKATYELADVGAVWIHRIEWNKDPMIKKVLLAAPSVNVKELKDLNALYSTFNYTQAVIPQTARAYLVEAFKKPPTAASWKTAIVDFLEQLAKVKEEDKWFSSLWSFQEGVLLQSQAFIDKTGQYLRHDGTASDFIAPVDRLPFPRIKTSKDEADALGLWHLTTLTTLLAGYMAQAIRDPSKAIKELAGVTQLPACSTFLSDKLHILGTSGLLFYPQNSPLEMICAARRSRETNWSVLDRYYAMIGVLGISLIADYGATEERAQQIFFPAVLQAFQWPTLLLARSLQPPPQPESWWLAVSTGLIEPLGGYFDAGFVAKGAKAPPTYPPIHYEQATDEIVLSKPPMPINMKRNDEPPSLNIWEPASWTKSTFYYILHTLPMDSKISQQVMLQDIKLNEANLGSDMHLIPIQRLDGATADANKPFDLAWSPAEKGKPRSVRCLLVKGLSKPTATSLECSFMGIIEVHGLVVRQYQEYESIKMKWRL